MVATAILIVEDDPAIAADLEAKLAALGHEITGVAQDGQSAIRLATQRRPGVIILDIGLKGAMDGPETALCLRDLASVPIIGITPPNDTAGLRRAWQALPSGFIAPPFQPAALQATIGLALHRHAMEKELKSARHWLASMLNSMGDAVAAIDAQGRVTLLNPAAEALTGWRHSHALGVHYAQPLRLLSDPDRAPIALIDSGAAGPPLPLRRAAILSTRSGGEIPVEFSLAPIEDTPGRRHGYVLVLRRLQAPSSGAADTAFCGQAALSIFNGMDDLIYVADPATHELLYVNEALQRAWKGESLTGRPCYSALQGLDAPCPFCTNERIFGPNLGKTWTWESRNRVTGRWFRCADKAIPWPDGRMVRFEIATDLTERKEAEEEQRRFHAKVLQAQKLESLGVLAGGIAHDFNNLLMGIMGNTDLALMETPETAPSRANLIGIQKASQRASGLVRQLLAYAGQGRYFVAPASFNQIIEGMAALLDASISKKAALRTALAPDLPLVEADTAQIRQAILNLVVNASEALGPNGGDITITTGVVACDAQEARENTLASDLTPGVCAFVEVQDTGCGMDDETVKRVFDPFFSTKFAGRGLGLPAVLGIARSHKGGVQVRSQPGKGSTFRILLPLLDQPAALATAAPSQPPPAQAQASPQAQAGAVRPRPASAILVVDDEPSVREVAAAMLRKAGYPVILASDGREAVQVFRSRATEVACVVLDLAMPRQDGEETLREIRRASPSVPVILSSGYAQETATQRFGRLSLAGFIQKPYAAAQLVACVQKVFPAHAEDLHPPAAPRPGLEKPPAQHKRGQA